MLYERENRPFFLLCLFTLLFFCGGTARPESRISGVLDTSVYVYPAPEQDPSNVETQCRVHETLTLDIDFTDKLSFNTYDRITYGTNTYEYPDYVDLNFFYGYFTCTFNDTFAMKIGRIMDINNLVYTNYDGLDLSCSFDVSKHTFNFDLYAGMVVNDDYLDDSSLIGLNSLDIRNAFIMEREGDYLSGFKFSSTINEIIILGLNYQTLFNKNSLTEHYLSLDFDTYFSKWIKFYGYGTFDFAGMEPVNALAAARVFATDYLSIILDYEYYVPVFPKNSYFWAYFETYGTQEARAAVLYLIDAYMSLDLHYGVVFYETEKEPGHEVSVGFEHRKFFNSSVRVNAEYLTGPEGDKITAMATFKKHYGIFDFTGGCGAVFYDEDDIDDDVDIGTFVTAGIDAEVLDSLTLSLTADYYYNPQYEYDLRGYFSMKYFYDTKKEN